jgi:hypothetical protein
MFGEKSSHMPRRPQPAGRSRSLLTTLLTQHPIAPLTRFCQGVLAALTHNRTPPSVPPIIRGAKA